MTMVTLTSKGQLTLPIEVRRALGLKDSDKLEVVYNPENRKITISKPMTVDELTAMTSRLPRKNIAPITDVNAYYQTHRGDIS
jgi:antitoxin PrlF